ncbi:MAG: penicillin-binding transpeptidase domain-containing protein [Eubacteriales bacterium]|nr:penicillin-binding transpeptidase domain-containing protein [Eubacteriales bacterium]
MKQENRGGEQAVRLSRQMLRRGAALAALFGIGMLAVLLARLYRLQISQHDFYESLALEQQLRETKGAAARGTITDTNFNPLAVSATVENVYFSPMEIEADGEDRELIARGLAEILGADPDDLYEKTGRKGSWYVTAARKLEREQADRVRAFKAEHGLKGVRLEADTKRYYPNSRLACHLLGFVGTDNTGLEGIEARYDEVLSGTAGRSLRATNAYGSELLFSRYEDYRAGQEGSDIVLTLDATVQYYVEKHLRQAALDYDAVNGAGAIAMDPKTGAILAMASLDDYDPNDFLTIGERAQEQADEAQSDAERAERIQAAQARQWRNKALSDTYEPGSTFKIITLAMALEEGKVSLSDSFYCGGSVNVTGRTNPIRCWKSGGHGSQSLTQAVQHSCNAAFVNIGLRVGAERFYDYCEAFGFLKLSDDPDASLSARTGVDLSGESGSIWWSRNTFCSKKNLSQLAAASFGQTFTITPLQLVCAVSACVNGGYLMEPYVVRQIVAPDGTVTMNREPHVVRQVISENTSRQVRAILEQVVGDPKEGTGRNAAVTGYRIGGKTGTSEKVSLEARTGQKEYIVSFIGFAPADDPKIVLLVFLDTPSDKSGVYVSGGQMAAPVVGRMLADILPYLGAVPDSGGAVEARMPACVGMTLAEAAESVRAAGLRCRTIGDGETVTDQLPAAGSEIAEGTEIILYLGADISHENECVPDLTGMRYDEARDTLSFYGLYLNTRSALGGERTVSAQSLPAGSLAEHGTVLEVTLVDQDETMLGKY